MLRDQRDTSGAMGIAPHCLPEVIQTIYYNAHDNYALKTGWVACKIK
jgi:hypothetical protein